MLAALVLLAQGQIPAICSHYFYAFPYEMFPNVIPKYA